MIRNAMICILCVVATPSLAQNQTVPDVQATQQAASPVASKVAAMLFPDGTYRKMLGESFSKMMSAMIDNMGDLPLKEIVQAAGGGDALIAKLDKTTVNRLMAIVDPAFKERMRLTMDGMFKNMIPLFESMEPELRAGLAESLDHRFTAAQLGELKGFFDTPTGASFASQQMLLFMDPAVMGRMQTQMPKIMQAMPQLVGEAMKATANLPKPKKYDDLTSAEREELTRLLGVDVKKTKR